MLGGATAATYAEALPLAARRPAGRRRDRPLRAHRDRVGATTWPRRSTARSRRPTGREAGARGRDDGGRGSGRAPHGEGRVAAFAYPESAARALGRAAARAEWLRRPHGIDPEARRHRPTRRPSASSSAALVAARRRLARGRRGARAPARLRPPARPRADRAAPCDDAVAAARELGFPVVVKTAPPGRTRRTSAASRSTSTTRTRCARPCRADRRARRSSSRWSRGGAELLAGVVQDPVFGPLVAFGPGGVLAELIGEAGFRIAPLDRSGRRGARPRAARPAGSSAGSAVRRRRTPERSSTSSTASRASATTLPAVAELDLNPVIARPTAASSSTPACACVARSASCAPSPGSRGPRYVVPSVEIGAGADGVRRAV